MNLKIIKRIIHSVSEHPERFFLIVALFFGSLSAFLVPQLTGFDETAHFKRAYSLSELHFSAQSCSFPTGITDKLSTFTSGNLRSEYNDKLNLDSRTDNTCGSAAGYSPLAHTPQAIGISFAKLIYPSTGFIILAGRLMGVIFYAISLYFVIKYARIGKWAIVAISLLPVMVHQASSLSADTFNNVIVIAFISYAFSLIVQKKNYTIGQLTIISILGVMLSLTKLHHLALLLLLILLPIKYIPFARKHLIKYALIVAIGALSLVAVFTWQRLANIDVIPSSMLTENPLSSNPLFFMTILYNTYINPLIGYTDLVAEGVVDTFSSFRYSLPVFVEYIAWSTVFLALLHTKGNVHISKKLQKYLTLISVATFSILLAAISYAMFTGWALQPNIIGPNATHAEGVQGRYFTALLILFIPIGILLGNYVRISFSRKHLHVILICISILFCLSFYLIETYFYKISLA